MPVLTEITVPAITGAYQLDPATCPVGPAPVEAVEGITLCGTGNAYKLTRTCTTLDACPLSLFCIFGAAGLRPPGGQPFHLVSFGQRGGCVRLNCGAAGAASLLSLGPVTVRQQGNPSIFFQIAPAMTDLADGVDTALLFNVLQRAALPAWFLSLDVLCRLQIEVNYLPAGTPPFDMSLYVRNWTIGTECNVIFPRPRGSGSQHRRR